MRRMNMLWLLFVLIFGRLERKGGREEHRMRRYRIESNGKNPRGIRGPDHRCSCRKKKGRYKKKRIDRMRKRPGAMKNSTSSPAQLSEGDMGTEGEAYKRVNKRKGCRVRRRRRVVKAVK